MAPLFRLLTLCLLLNLSLPAAIAGQVSKDDLDAQKELLQLKIDSGKESAQKDIEALGKRIEAVDKRVDDLVNRFSDLGLFSVVFTTLVTIILWVLGMLGYLSVASRSEKIAKATATTTAEKWFNDHQQDLQKQITKTQTTAQQAQRQAQAAIKALQQARISHDQEMAELRALKESARDELTELLSHMQYIRNKVDNQAAELDLQMEKNTARFASGSNTEPAQERLGQPDEEQNTIAHERSVFSPEPSEQIARNMIIEGISLGAQKMPIEEMKLYEQVIREYGNETSPEVRALVARAMLYMGTSLRKLGWLGKAQEIFEQLIEQYGNDTHPETRLQVASAIANKGTILGYRGRQKEKLEAFEQIIEQYGDDVIAETKELVTLTMSSYAQTLLLGVKSQLAATPTALVQAKTDLSKGQELLQKALERKPGWGMALGILAYVQWLLQDPAAAETSFRQALHASEDGSEALHRATLDDIEQHPIPADQGFRELVDRLWAEYQSQVPGQATG